MSHSSEDELSEQDIAEQLAESMTSGGLDLADPRASGLFRLVLSQVIQAKEKSEFELDPNQLH